LENDFKEYINLGLSLPNAYFIWMGDLLEMGGRNSPGTSLFHQIKQPQEQYDWVIETLTPVAHKSILYHSANHERRIETATGIDISKNIARELKIPYAPLMAMTRIVLKNQAYNIHSFHGSGGARLPHTKIQAHKNAIRFLEGFDIYLMGHVHYDYNEEFLIKRLNLKLKTPETVFGHRILTGHFLEWDESYAEEKGFEPLPSGAPIIELNALEHDIRIRKLKDFK